MDELKNKIALVTGASRGIGKAIALAFADEGINIVVNYQYREAGALEVCKMIQSKGIKAWPIRADVSEAEQVSAMISKIEKEIGEINILVNNAGISLRRKVEETTEDDFDKMIKINLKSGFLVTQAVLPGMRKNKWGRIIMISSVAAQTGGVIGLHYAASKAGQLGMMHFYAKNLATEGITVNAIAPAIIETNMINELGAPSPSTIPVGRFGTADEVAQAAVLLVMNGYITNQTINVNGGWHPSS
ncbi:MAG: SDR family NAD(P)-dependent oxidoreductase [Chitinophagales bacterium]